MNFNGLNTNMGNLFLTSKAKTRSISPENYTGEKGKGGMMPLEEGIARNAAQSLGTGWKVNPHIRIQPNEIFTIAEISEPGCIQQIWLTPTGNWRETILRVYWDGNAQPSIECPIGDFFASTWNHFAQLNSLAVCVNPGSAFNCYWQMPFKKSCRMTLENRGIHAVNLYYQINYVLTDIPDDAAYFHAQFRRTNPLPYGDVYTIVDGIEGEGQYVGTYMAWQVNSTGWWGEGEIKFFMDGDGEFPTICGTGTEDYFCGSYNFENQRTRQYQEFSTPYAGLHNIVRPDGVYNSQQRFGMYRWHIVDPIRFEKDLRVTIQALGWMNDNTGRYLPLRDDIASVAYWYQTTPAKKFPQLPDKDYLMV